MPIFVSTHSRPKAAGIAVNCRCGDFKFQHTAARRRLAPAIFVLQFEINVSTHSRPKAAGSQTDLSRLRPDGFNTQPPEGGWNAALIDQVQFIVSTHSRPKAAGPPRQVPIPQSAFQHTAARRRLVWLPKPMTAPFCFNTQPPEGGW